MITLGEIIKAHRDFFGEYAKCIINEEVFYGEGDSEDYEQHCSLMNEEVYTIKDKDKGLIGSICGNHVEELKELGVDGIINHYSDDLYEDDYNTDSDISLFDFYMFIYQNAEKFV